MLGEGMITEEIPVPFFARISQGKIQNRKQVQLFKMNN
jgi:hypothetical protein